jgi:hypothetical protein
MIYRLLVFLLMLGGGHAFAQTTTVASTIGTAASQLVGQESGRSYLSILNQSTTATIACTLDGTTPSVNGAGSVTMSPLGGFVWDTGKIPWGPVTCISSASSTPVTVVKG